MFRRSRPFQSFGFALLGLALLLVWSSRAFGTQPSQDEVIQGRLAELLQSLPSARSFRLQAPNRCDTIDPMRENSCAGLSNREIASRCVAQSDSAVTHSYAEDREYACDSGVPPRHRITRRALYKLDVHEGRIRLSMTAKFHLYSPRPLSAEEVDGLRSQIGAVLLEVREFFGNKGVEFNLEYEIDSTDLTRRPPEPKYLTEKEVSIVLDAEKESNFITHATWINLFPKNSLKNGTSLGTGYFTYTLAHELAHHLGLPDEYRMTNALEIPCYQNDSRPREAPCSEDRPGTCFNIMKGSSPDYRDLEFAGDDFYGLIKDLCPRACNFAPVVLN
jgi:hypothetical protein